MSNIRERHLDHAVQDARAPRSGVEPIFRPFVINAVRLSFLEGTRTTKPSENLTPVLVELINRAPDTFEVVLGRLPSEVYEYDTVIIELLNLLRRGGTVDCVFFAEGASSPSDSRRILEDAGSPILDLQRRYPEQVRLYWLKKRPYRHLLVIDRRDVLLEDIHEEGQPPGTKTWFGDYKWGKKWHDHFEEYRAEGEQLRVA